MTTIDLSAIEDAKIQELAVKATLKGVLVDYLGPHTVKTTPGDKVFHPFVVTSVSDPSRFHDVLIWREQGKWLADCDADNEDGCEANRKGGKLCSHLAIAFTELKKELGKQEVA